MKFALNRSLLPLLLLVGLSLFISACTPGGSTGRGFAYIWYMDTAGDDGNNCSDPSTPCRTLRGVVDKASAENRRLADEYPDLLSVDHTINLAAGTYNETSWRDGYAIASIGFNVVIQGAGQSTTIINVDGNYAGIHFRGASYARIRDLTVQNASGQAPHTCLYFREVADVTIENVTVQRCLRSGISNGLGDTMTLNNVTAIENINDGFGNGLGVSSSTNNLIVNGGEFSRNELTGLVAHGNVMMNFVLVHDNHGQGLYLTGTGTLSEVDLRRNGLVGPLGVGAGLRLHGTDITVENSTIIGNVYGAYLYDGAQVHLVDTLISDHSRSGVYIDDGELRLTGSTIRNNGEGFRNTSLGGGIHVDVGNRAVINNSEIIGNHNGGIINYGEVFLTESSLTGNDGNTAFAILTGAAAVIERSLIANNLDTSSSGLNDPGIDNRGNLNIINSTISGNASSGLISSGPATLAYVTIVENGDYGLVVSESASVFPSLANVLLGGNGNADCYLPRSGSYSLSGNNMDTDGSCAVSSTVAPADLLLGPLADNGGPTHTHALDPASPAANTATGSCPVQDQRLAARPFGPACDLGAFEAGGSALSLDTEDEGLDLTTVTPTAGGPGFLVVIPDQNYNCRYGNGSAFDIADTLVQGEEYVPLGIGNDELWFQFAGPTFGQLCWTPVSAFTLFLDGVEVQLDQLPDTLLQVINYPPLPPTATPTPDLDESYDVTPTPLPSPTATCDPQQQQCP